MKKFIMFAVAVIGALVVGLGGIIIYVKTMLPAVGEPPALQIKATPAMVERGKYLAHHVMVCIDCHSERDWSLFSGPPKDGTWGRGGEIFDQKFGFPGKFVASNITPANLSSWSDGEIFRAVTSGVGKDGRALFPIMPYKSYGQLDENDIKAVIAYVRTLAPIENSTERSEADFPMSVILHTIPSAPAFKAMPATSDKVQYGKYLVTAASCNDCHTKQDKGEFVGEPFAGGFEFPLLGGSKVISSNITPHETGIGSWTEEHFIQRFRMYATADAAALKNLTNEYQSIMPWTMYAGMKDEDLSAIYQYLRTLKPVENKITRYIASK
jgi:mono/diheme cytochrome c family protein